MHTTTFYLTYYSAPDRGARSIVMSVYVCVCLSVLDHIFGTTRSIFTKFFVHVTYGCGRSSSNGVVIRYVFPVLWMTSYLHISQLAARRRHQAEVVRLTCTLP